MAVVAVETEAETDRVIVQRQRQRQSDRCVMFYSIKHDPYPPRNPGGVPRTSPGDRRYQ